MSGHAWGWIHREPPLAPVAVAAWRDAARGLASRLLQRSDETLAGLFGVAGEEVLLLLGASMSLPWVDGALYLGQDPQARSLLLPTHSCPDVPVALLEKALLRSTGAPGGARRPPLALLPGGLLLSAHAARPLSRARLLAFTQRDFEAS